SKEGCSKEDSREEGVARQGHREEGSGKESGTKVHDAHGAAIRCGRECEEADREGGTPGIGRRPAARGASVLAVQGAGRGQDDASRQVMPVTICGPAGDREPVAVHHAGLPQIP
ncbi:MAG: hypothetical protein Q4F49_10340, partial [Pseudoxanthomonas suwonensis]|nr:hypothetical protein [Pseudoxanthomonas suwonensis]